MEFSDIITPLTFAISLWIAIRHFRFTKTLEAIDYFTSDHMLDVRWKVDRWLEKELSDEDRLSEIETDEELSKSLRTLYVGLTRISASYKYGLLYKKQIKEQWGDMLKRYYEEMRFYVEDKRSRGRNIGFLFENMIRSMHKNAIPYKPMEAEQDAPSNGG